jgi:hypothetical protein
MEVENALGLPLSDEEMLIQSCVDPNDPGHQQPRDYTNYLYVINSYMIFFIVVKYSDPEKQIFEMYQTEKPTKFQRTSI